MAQTARRAFIATVVALSVVVFAVALWKLRLLLALVFTGFIIAAAIRPGVEALHRRRVPRAAGLGAHYLVFAGLIALILWFAVPRALHQVTAAVDNLPETRQQIGQEARQSEGIKQRLLVALQRRLKELPQGGDLVRPAAEVGRTATE